MDYDSVPEDEEEKIDKIPSQELQKDSSELLKDVEKLQKADLKTTQNNNVFVTIENLPKKVILNQRVKLKLKLTIARDDISDISVKAKKSKYYTLYTTSGEWKKISDNRYIKTIYIKYKTTNPKAIRLKIRVEFKEGFANEANVLMDSIRVVKLASNKLFCGVLAKNIDIISHSQKVYDDKSNIVLVELNATDSNLDDFKIPYAIKSGVDEFSDSGESQKVFGYAIVDKNLEIFKFKYFNTKTNHYELKSFDIVLKDQSLSTQTDLNPAKNKFALYESIAMGIVGAIFLLLFIKNRSTFSLIIAILLLGYTIYKNFPLKSVVLKKGIGIKILPTKNSTIFYTLPHDTKAKVAYERKGYYKVILPNNKIGWVKKSD